MPDLSAQEEFDERLLAFQQAQQDSEQEAARGNEGARQSIFRNDVQKALRVQARGGSAAEGGKFAQAGLDMAGGGAGKIAGKFGSLFGETAGMVARIGAVVEGIWASLAAIAAFIGAWLASLGWLALATIVIWTVLNYFFGPESEPVSPTPTASTQAVTTPAPPLIPTP